MRLFEVSDGFAGLVPRKEQFYNSVTVPDGVIVPIKDAISWQIYPRHRWVYNKLLICETQGVPHGPHGSVPFQFPIFSKPIYNMNGMGTGSRLISNLRDYDAAIEPGYMWMPLFEGRHLSTDVALAHGVPCWWQHTTGVPGKQCTFDYWIIHAEPEPAVEEYLTAWIAKHLQGFSGVVNLETIGGRIIECHLRMTSQWPDLNGPGWLKAVVDLYAYGLWEFGTNRQQRVGYSVVLFANHGKSWSIDRNAVKALLPAAGVTSIQLTFEDEACPEGGTRLAIINCWNLEAGLTRPRSTYSWATSEIQHCSPSEGATSMWASSGWVFRRGPIRCLPSFAEEQ
ncbi:hypothetical protein KC19_12G024800 [Ceratodon purpureus]|uniref:Uncharacterized protein n=1 Tax=Ceratodon purpureus TaxID=3225 RepID=A0A8T0G2R5_CERPU|nr:hypothetical protein KC19_12G024800 [Ceratodon purpureus]